MKWDIFFLQKKFKIFINLSSSFFPFFFFFFFFSSTKLEERGEGRREGGGINGGRELQARARKSETGDLQPTRKHKKKKLGESVKMAEADIYRLGGVNKIPCGFDDTWRTAGEFGSGEEGADRLELEGIVGVKRGNRFASWLGDREFQTSK